MLTLRCLNVLRKAFTFCLEPQNVSGKEFKEILDEYYGNIALSKLQEKKAKNDSGGCLLIAVYRGKISEGLDFIDDNARAVIAVGIPFPSTQDIQVVSKKDFNTKYAITKGLLNGHQWYGSQHMLTVIHIHTYTIMYGLLLSVYCVYVFSVVAMSSSL